MNTIDHRVVEMRFNNRQFESNIKQTLESLRQLKSGLKLEDSARGLQSLESASRRFSLDNIASSLEQVAGKFTALGIIGTTALVNLANSAINAGKRIVSALTVEPIMTGYSEYELKMGSIQTIMASTGESLKVVNGYLGDLNTYSDKTIYSFSDMTQNIGKFTNAGVKLDKAVTAIKGISNEAAVSGANANEASRAMYNFAQALSAGYVKLIDWKSIENANMATVEFKDQLIQTALELGTVTDAGEGMYRTLDGNVFNATKNFNEVLQDQWMTTDVLVDTLSKYADETTEIGKKAYAAAQDVKTFSQLFDTLKEAAQSGWSTSWEFIIGDFEEAKELLTNINNAMGGVIDGSADARNKILEDWKALGGRTNLIEGLATTFKNLADMMTPIREAFREVFPEMTGDKLFALTTGFTKLIGKFKIGSKTAENLKATFKGLFSALHLVGQVVWTALRAFAELVGIVLPMGDGILGITGAIGSFVTSLDEAVESSGLLNTMLDTLKEALKIFPAIFGGLEKLGPMFKKFLDVLGGIFKGLAGAINTGLEGFSFDNLLTILNGGILATILLGVKRFMNNLLEMVGTGDGLLSSIKSILGGVKDSLVSYQNDLKAGTLQKIAIAVGILAGSLFILSLIDPKKMETAITGMTVIFTELFAFMALFGNAVGGFKLGSMISITTTMIGMATAVLILSFALSKLSKLDWEQIAKGLTAIAGLSLILIASAKLLSANTRTMIKGGLSFIFFAGALTIMSFALKKISELDWDEIGRGLSAIGGLLAELAIFMYATNFTKMSLKSSLGIIIVAGALRILASSVKALGTLDDEVIMKGLATIAGLLTELAIFMQLTMNPKHVISTAIGITILSGALLILSVAIKAMGSLSWEQIGKGLLVMASSLTIMAIAMKFMRGAIPGAIAIGILAGALAVLAPVLLLFGKMKMETIGKSMLMLAGIFVIFGAAAAILGPLIPVMLGLGASIMLLGIGVSLVGGGVLALALGLTALGVGASAAAAGIVIIATSLINLIPVLLEKIGIGLVAFGEVIIKSAPVICEAITVLLVSLVDAIIVIVPKLVDGMMILLDTLLNKVLEFTPKLVDAGMQLIVSILEGITKSIDDVVSAAVDLVVAFIEAIGKESPRLIDAGFMLLINLINGMAKAIEEDMPLLLDAISGLILVIIGGAIKALESTADTFKKAGDLLMNSGFIKGLTDAHRNVKSAGEVVGEKTVEGLRSTKEDFEKAGKYVIEGFIKGMDSKKKEVIGAGTRLGVLAYTSAQNSLDINSPSKKFAKLGEFSVLGFIKGLGTNIKSIGSSAKDIGDVAITSLSKSISSIADLMNLDLDVNPTIRPVLDMSAVTKDLASTFGQEQGINVTSMNAKTSTIASMDLDRRSNDAASVETNVSVLGGLREALQNGIDKVKSELEVSGVIRVEGINNQGELTAVLPLLARELKIDQGRYSNIPSIRRMYR